MHKVLLQLAISEHESTSTVIVMGCFKINGFFIRTQFRSIFLMTWLNLILYKNLNLGLELDFVLNDVLSWWFGI